MNAMFPHAPRGRDLPIPCKYPFTASLPEGEAGMAYAPARWQTPIPEGWKEEWIPADEPELEEAGFKVAAIYINEKTQMGRFTPWHEGQRPVGYLFLRDHEGNLVATWDEGRWWTPDESDQFQLMLQVPAALDFQKRGPHGEFGQGR